MTLGKEARAMWHVLRLINNNLTDTTSVQYGIYQYDRNLANELPTMSEQINVLEGLQEQGVIAFDEQPRCELYLEGDGPEYVYVYDLSIKNIAKFKALYEQHQKLERKRLEAQPISLSYDPTSGIGWINGDRELRLRGKNKRVFNRLYADANKWVERTAIFKAVSYKYGLTSKRATHDCNTLITNLRKATALKPQHIVVHDGQFMLKATIADS